MKPLNPALYSRLKRFGKVRVSNEGEAFKYRAVRGLEDEPLLDIAHDGEFYMVCCPFCRDTRFRLYVNHMYAQRDRHGRRMTFLAICYNQNCLARRDNQLEFQETLDSTEMLTDVRVFAGREVPEEARVVQWPGNCKLVNTLRANHHAVQYLESRGFDPDFLARRYQVSYCRHSHFSLARDRLIFPVFEGDQLKGWQARVIGELPWKDKTKKQGLPPKYFSTPSSNFRSRCILNWDRMRLWKTGIVVEGPTDVYKFGPMSGCIFGNTVTPLQRRKLVTVFKKRGRSLVLLLDPEEFESRSTQKAIRMMERAMRGQFCAVKLPDKTDPGSLDQAFSREYVRQEAAKQGVTVLYERA